MLEQAYEKAAMSLSWGTVGDKAIIVLIIQ